MSGRARLAVVGNGMATVRLLETLHARAPGKYQIDVFGAEPQAGYNRVLLSPLLAGEQDEAQLVTRDADWYYDCGFRLHSGRRVLGIDRARRRLRCDDGAEYDYDRLVLATGSEAFVPPVPGADLPGALGFRSLADVRQMQAHIARHPGEPVVVAGGGLLGIEAACALAAQGAAVTLLQRGSHLMNRQLDAEAGEMLAEELRRRGITLRCNTEICAVEGRQRVERLRLRGERQPLAAGLLVWAVGIAPQTELAAAAGLAVDAGIRVDAQLRSSDPAIFAIGECAEFASECCGLVAPAYAQAEACAAQLLGDTARHYAPEPLATRLKVSGVALFSMGELTAKSGDETLCYRDRALGVYRKLLLRDGRLVGALCYGDTRDAGWYERLIIEADQVGARRAGLAFGEATCEQLLKAA